MCHGLEIHVRDLMEIKFEAFGGSNINKVWGVYRNHPVRPSMYLVSATPPKRLIGFLLNFTHL